jgi:outer membrane assembly lipoprotein YfiO
LLLPAAAGCAYSFTKVHGRNIADVEAEEIVEAAWESYNVEKYETASHLAAYVPEFHPDSEVAEEALFLAGDSSYRMGELWQSFTYFKELLSRYPLSQYVRDIAERDFLIGEYFLEGDVGFFTNRDSGVKVMTHLVTNFSHHELADDAQMAMAEYFFREEEYEDSAINYKELLKRYPNSEWAEKATVRLGLSHFNVSKGHSYDRERLLMAWIVLDNYLTNYEKGSYRAEALETSQKSRELLAQKELEIANFYHQQQSDLGARIHLANILILFPDTESGEKAKSIMDEFKWDTSLHSADRIVPKESMSFLRGSNQDFPR